MDRLFTPAEWSVNASVYEVNLRQYTAEGSFNAFAASLTRLRDMGVTVLWFMPITPISVEKRLGSLGSYYACSDYTDTNPEFGSIEDFRNLVNKAHELGFKVIIDWVANHTGWDHRWTKTNPEFYKINSAGGFYDNHGWEDVIDLNYYDHAMRKEMIASMEFWINTCGIDGFRCDMAHLVPLDFWRQARRHLDGVKPLFWLAETEDPNYQQVFDCCYAWHWMHQSEQFMRGSIDVGELKKTLAAYQENRLPGTAHLFFTSNHDENSWNGTEYEKYGSAAVCFAVFSLTWSGMPLIYSGQELPNHKRLKFFDKDVIEWTGEYRMHDFYKTLLGLRARMRFATGDAQLILLDFIKGDGALVYLQISGEQQALTLLNLSGSLLSVTIAHESISGYYTNVFSGEKTDFSTLTSITLLPWAYMVFEK